MQQQNNLIIFEAAALMEKDRRASLADEALILLNDLKNSILIICKDGREAETLLSYYPHLPRLAVTSIGDVEQEAKAHAQNGPLAVVFKHRGRYAKLEHKDTANCIYYVCEYSQKQYYPGCLSYAELIRIIRDEGGLTHGANKGVRVG